MRSTDGMPIEAHRNFPRLDIYACKADFDSWVLGKEVPKDYQKAFLGFVQKLGVGKS